MRGLIAVPLALLLSGCIAKTAVDVVTLPVKVASGTVDILTTSQSEADEKRGRAIRKQEKREAKARRKAEREARRQARAEAERND